MTTERIAAQLGYDVASATLGHVQSVCNGVKFAVNLLYKILQFGFKQFVGGFFN